MRALKVALVFLIGCGPDAAVDGGSDATVADAVPADAVADAGADVPHEAIAYDVVDGGGDEPYCFDNGNVKQACCNGQACKGFCVVIEDGGVGCTCYGVPEGCGGLSSYYDASVQCCALQRGCAPGDCSTSGGGGP